MSGWRIGSPALAVGLAAGLALVVGLASRPGVDLPRVCEVVRPGSALPWAVSETSGLARSERVPGRFWTLNDAGNGPVLFALDTAGDLVGRVRVAGARNRDWEDMESGACEDGPCLYVADIGDNEGERSSITVYRVPEPDPGAGESAAATAFPARYPDGARDAEALFVVGGRPYVVTKGRDGPIALYRYPEPLRAGRTVTLERVGDVLPTPAGDRDRVTGASASPDGRRVAIRSYRRLHLFPADELIAGSAVEPEVFDLSTLGEAQGEAVALGAAGEVWLTTEADGDTPPRWARLRCVTGDG
jgi:hypothetical protein